MSEAVPVLDDFLHALRCPVCGGGLARADGAARCGEGHSFDVARQGYLSLLTGDRRGHPGDTAAMVAARERFLAGGHFHPLADAVGETVGRRELGRSAPLVVDLGAGTGWYLAHVLDRLPDALGLALEVSKPALRRAARAHPRAAAVACDAWGALPVRDGVADVLLNVFAPRNGAEMARVLREDGVAVVVTPAAGHLAELVGPLGLLRVDERKDERLEEQLAPHLTVADRRELEWPLQLDHAAARDLAAMGPSAFHVDPAELAGRLAPLPEQLKVSAAVTVTVATRRGSD